MPHSDDKRSVTAGVTHCPATRQIKAYIASMICTLSESDTITEMYKEWDEVNVAFVFARVYVTSHNLEHKVLAVYVTTVTMALLSGRLGQRRFAFLSDHTDDKL
jgi:hypothetical protein